MSFIEMNNNKVYICGEVLTEPKFSHELFGEGFYEFYLKVMRLSNTFDIIPVTISERILNNDQIKVGKIISCTGQFRSYNKMEDNKSRLMLTVFIREIVTLNEIPENENNIEITGYICKEPIFRTTPFNREICDVLIAVNRNYNKSDYIPCIAWGRNAKFVRDLNVGDKIKVTGRIQSREYQKKNDLDEFVTKTAYEVSLNKVILAEDEEVYKEDELIDTSIGKLTNYYVS